MGKRQKLAEYKCTVAPILAPVYLSLFVCLVVLGLWILLASKSEEEGGGGYLA